MGGGGLRRNKTTTSTTLHNNFEYLLVLHPHCLGLKRNLWAALPLCGPSETNCGLACHIAGTAIFQNPKGGGGSHTRTGPSCPWGRVSHKGEKAEGCNCAGESGMFVPLPGDGLAGNAQSKRAMRLPT